MAMQILAGDVGRTDLFFIDPKEIVINENLNGRIDPHDDDEIDQMVASYEAPDLTDPDNPVPTGQIQAVQVRRLPDKRVQLVLGFRRAKSMLKYNELHPGPYSVVGDDGNTYHYKKAAPLKLKCQVVTISDEEALRRNIVENKDRKRTNPMDDYFNQKNLREQYGWSNERIAKFYKQTPPYVGQLAKMGFVSAEIRQKVKRRELSVDAALGLADLPENVQKDIMGDLNLPANIQAAIIQPGTPTVVADDTPAVPLVNDPAQVAPDTKPGETLSQAVKRKVRDAKVAAGGKQPRNLREVRRFLEELTGPAEKNGVKTLAELFLKFIQGYYTDAGMAKKIAGLFPASPVAQDVPETPDDPQAAEVPAEAVAVAPVAQEGQPQDQPAPAEVVEIGKSELDEAA